MGTWGRGVTSEQLSHLQRYLEAHALLKGDDFTLSSGIETKYYFNAKPVTLSGEGLDLVAQVMTQIVKNLGAEGVGGLEIGAVPIALAIAHRTWQDGDEIPAFIVRDAQKKHGTKELIATSHKFVEPSGGQELKRRVVVVDDVVTTGASVIKAIDVLHDQGHEILGVVALVTRPENGGMPEMVRMFAEKANCPYLSVFECDMEGNLNPLIPEPATVSSN